MPYLVFGKIAFLLEKGDSHTCTDSCAVSTCEIRIRECNFDILPINLDKRTAVIHIRVTCNNRCHDRITVHADLNDIAKSELLKECIRSDINIRIPVFGNFDYLTAYPLFLHIWNGNRLRSDNLWDSLHLRCRTGCENNDDG